MVKHEIMIIADYSQDALLSIDEVCEICGISTETIHELITYDIIRPAHSVGQQWVFGLTELQRIKTTQRLQRDLEINLAGVALVLDLLDEIEELRTRAEILERYLSRR